MEEWMGFVDYFTQRLHATVVHTLSPVKTNKLSNVCETIQILHYMFSPSYHND